MWPQCAICTKCHLGQICQQGFDRTVEVFQVQGSAVQSELLVVILFLSLFLLVSSSSRCSVVSIARSFCSSSSSWLSSRSTSFGPRARPNSSIRCVVPLNFLQTFLFCEALVDGLMLCECTHRRIHACLVRSVMYFPRKFLRDVVYLLSLCASDGKICMLFRIVMRAHLRYSF